MNKFNIAYVYLFLLLPSYALTADLPASLEKPSKKQKAKKAVTEIVRSANPEIADLSEFIAAVKELNLLIGEIKPTLVALKPYIDQIETEIRAEADYIEEDANAVCCPHGKATKKN